MDRIQKFEEFTSKLLSCRKCPEMVGSPVHGCVLNSKIISIGQAPGIHEEKFNKPFAYTAGKTLFKWFLSIGICEEDFRKNVNMSAVCRCFPGKCKNGDRKPNKLEIKNCSEYLKFEIEFHKPKLIIPIGKLAIDQFIGNKHYTLNDVIGNVFQTTKVGIHFDWIPLPHPSGLNVWNNTETGKKLIQEALNLLKNHQTISEIFFK